MNSTFPLNTQTLEPSKAKRADRTGFDQPVLHGGIELHASEVVQTLGGGGKKLFCRLPRPLQLALASEPDIQGTLGGWFGN